MSPAAVPKQKPKRAQTPDVGWRKALVSLAAIAALTVLQMADRLTSEVALYILGTAGAFMGANLAGYLRAPKP